MGEPDCTGEARLVLFLDQGRVHPRLGDRRHQLPRTLAFAIAAHAAQGHTFNKEAVVELNIEESSSTTPSYVAITCVKRREVTLVCRPAPLPMLNKG